MQNILLLHLREQSRLTLKQIEQRTGIPASRYLEYEKGSTSPCRTDATLLATLLNVKLSYLETYATQLEYLSHAKGIIDRKDKQVEQLTGTLQRKIRQTNTATPKEQVVGKQRRKAKQPFHHS